MKKRILWEYAVITFAAAITAAGVFFFMLPSHVAVGTGSALAMILSNFIPLPISVISLIINVTLLIVGFLLIGPEFGAKTVYVSILLPILLGVYELFFPNFQSLTGDPLLDLLCYTLVVGVGMALLFLRNASSGGLDIVAKIINKYTHMELGKAVSLSGMLVALSSALCYDTKIVVLSVLGTYASGIVVDHFIFGFDVKRRVCVLSERLDEIVDFVLHDLHSGATLYESEGAYNRTPRTEAVVIVNKQEYRLLMDFIRRTDPKAFVTVISINEVSYQPKNTAKTAKARNVK